MPSANPFARSPPTNPFASPPRAPAPTPRIPQPAGVPAPATVSGIFQTPFAEAGLGADLDMPMIVVPPPAPALGPPPTAEAPGLSALFDDIPRSDPSIPLQRTIPPVPADQPATPGFDIEVDFGEQGAVGDDPTVDMPNAQPETAHPLGAAIVAAYEHNRTAPVEVGQVVEVSTASMGADSLDTEQSTLSMPSPIVVRLRDLQYRLTAEGRRADAEIVAQALALLDSGGSSG